MRFISTAALALLLIAPATAQAELRHVQLSVLGMDWEICAHTVRVAMMKLPGVESAEVSLKKAQVDIRLKADNTLTMARIRAVLKSNGYPSRDATVEARGRIAERDGQRVFDLLNGSSLPLVGGSAELPTDGRVVTVTGTSRAGKATETLTVISLSEPRVGAGSHIARD